ncbi:MAG: pyridoxal phosphate-dependent aminotransferase [Proteobacteria bacterium]|nr:pyridoxal phosphate-dependent aminotransferase [Pseudomonadota bacterium]
MTQYNFDEVVSRKNTNCAKWDAASFLFGDNDVIPMWVADIDFPLAKPITDALQKRTEHAFYGYPLPSPFSAVEAVIQRMKKKFDWDVESEWIVFVPGVVPALYAAVKAYTDPGDSVLLQGPVYYPFWSAIEENGCHVANNQLKLTHGRYEIDFENLESQFFPKERMMPYSPRVKMMILCSPHNPVGRVWTEEELVKMGEILIKNKAVMVSDEIHCELLFNNAKHVPFAKISREFEQNSVVCMAPSKTFGLAGLGASVLIIPNKELRGRFNHGRGRIMSGVNIFGMVALEAAFRHGDEWLEQFMAYLHQNLDFLTDYIEKKIPKIKVIKPEGTYLIWLDCRELGMDAMALKEFMNKEARVGFDHGFAFGPSGAGFERINIACPRSLLAAALNRIETAVNQLGWC